MSVESNSSNSPIPWDDRFDEDPVAMDRYLMALPRDQVVNKLSMNIDMPGLYTDELCTRWRKKYPDITDVEVVRLRNERVYFSRPSGGHTIPQEVLTMSIEELEAMVEANEGEEDMEHDDMYDDEEGDEEGEEEEGDEEEEEGDEEEGEDGEEFSAYGEDDHDVFESKQGNNDEQQDEEKKETVEEFRQRLIEAGKEQKKLFLEKMESDPHLPADQRETALQHFETRQREQIEKSVNIFVITNAKK